ncbi:porin family protein [Vibrio sp. ZSDE26]|uniref:Porin family protein n=1 Tax=Vibrio amylolyticus TaxID=2847292 RepID=A0A9X1XQ07_9VIBR|nr:outer membrane beta-barrel protein [Vibrio amylolyticus]MCK6265015.1 porin family protein [Vibrio amylolyticus]
MKTHYWLAPTLTLLSISSVSSVHANTMEENKRGFYIGADLSVYNNTKLEVSDVSIQESSDFGDFGYNFLAGYEFDTHEVVKLGLEAEYRHFGKANYDDEFKIKGNGVFVNIKPKFIVQYDQADVYVSLLAGIGSMDMEAQVSNVSASKSELGYQFGAELGFIVNRDIDIHLGYRAAFTEIETIEVSTGSAYTGIRYFF